MLYIIPTPIGNLRDITLRALDVLNDVDVIVCEDTRRTRVLLNAHEIKKPMVSYHEHSKPEVLEALLGELKTGKKIALVSDGGTPLISDPGFKMVHQAIKNDIRVETLPGASACITALVSSGLAVDTFTFCGFLAPKSAPRKKELMKLANREETLIFYESPFRVVKSMQDMKEVLGDREAALARELTKKFEEVKRGKLSDLIEFYTNKNPKGEIVMIVSGKDRKRQFVAVTRS